MNEETETEPTQADWDTYLEWCKEHPDQDRIEAESIEQAEQEAYIRSMHDEEMS
jgi:hypothetical protein